MTDDGGGAPRRAHVEFSPRTAATFCQNSNNRLNFKRSFFAFIFIFIYRLNSAPASLKFTPSAAHTAPRQPDRSKTMSNFNPHGRSADYKEVTVHLPVDQAAELAKIYEGNPPRLTYYGGAVSIQRSAAELARLLAARPAEEFRLVHVGDAVDIMDKFPAMLVFAHATTQQRGEPR